MKRVELVQNLLITVRRLILTIIIEVGELVQNISIFYDLASSPDHIEGWELVQNYLLSIFYGLASSPDHIEGGELVQNYLLSIFYGSASSPDHIEGGKLVQNHLIILKE